MESFTTSFDIELFPTLDRLKRLGSRIIHFFPEDAPDYMSTHFKAVQALETAPALVLIQGSENAWESHGNPEPPYAA